ncbi:hypothetical protein LAZ67_12001763 [Cordylochernes scorpioides]|uniref:Reverse transcriptase n=1 Tax=Cordylochernes scorpioides TaxID=51811 RepID=A0ABY6L187_9ARAC|nr:hypothetical protein LAZ67_12001763 [Cordylochernes scorpioides]
MENTLDVLGVGRGRYISLSAATGLSGDVELPRYDGSYKAQSFFTNYDAQADRAQLQYTERLRKPPNLLQAPLRVTSTRARSHATTAHPVPGHIALATIDVHGEEMTAIAVHLAHEPRERNRQLELLAATAAQEEEGACWIIGDFNIRDWGPSSSSSSDALAALLDLAALVRRGPPSSTPPTCPPESPGTATRSNPAAWTGSSSLLESWIACPIYATSHYHLSDHRLLLLQVGPPTTAVSSPTQPRLAAMLRSGLVLEHLAGYIRELEEDTAHDDDDGILWDRWTTIKAGLLAEARSPARPAPRCQRQLHLQDKALYRGAARGLLQPGRLPVAAGPGARHPPPTPAGADATIRAGGFYTATFPFLNGLRQGCALSAALFSIATGLLLRRLELTFGVGNVTTYADDIVLLFHRDEDFERVATVFEDYRQASGVGVNLRKSAGFWCGAWRNRGDSPLGASWSTTSIRILGLDIAPSSTVAHREQYLLALLETACRRWTRFTRGLSLVGRARAGNTLVGSTIQLHLHGYLPSPPTIAKLQARLARIDWASLRRCAHSGHEADAALKLALHALPHPAHPASVGPSCPSCGSIDRSLSHRYWCCPSIRPLIREAFNIIGRPPDLQTWIFGGSGLEDDDLSILGSAKLRIYRYFVQAGVTHANLTAARGDVTAPKTAATTSATPANLASRNWGDSEMAEVDSNDGFTVVRSKKRRRGSNSSEHAAKQPSRPGVNRSSQQPTGPRTVPPQEIKATRANIADAKARQTTSNHENYIFVELCPEIPSYAYLRAIDKLDLANRLVEEGLDIEGTHLKVFPFRKRAERIIIANLPGFVEDSTIVEALRPIGNVTSIAPIMIKMGEYTFTDGRREAFILLRKGVKLETLPTRINIKSKRDTLPAFLSFGIKCSKCGKQGHRRANCPLLARQTSSPRQASSPTDARLPPPPPPQQPRKTAPAPATPASPITPAEKSTEAPAIPSAPQPAELENLAQPAPAAHPAPLTAPRPLEPGIPPLDLEMKEEELLSPPSTPSRKRAAIRQLREHLSKSPTFSFDQSKLHGLDWEDAMGLVTSMTNLTRQLPSLPKAQVAATAILATCEGSTGIVYKTLRKAKVLLVLLQVGQHTAAMLRSGLAQEHLAGYIRELEEDIAHDDDDGILWDRWTTIKAGLLAEARSLHDSRHAASDGYVYRARRYIAAQLEASSIGPTTRRCRTWHAPSVSDARDPAAGAAFIASSALTIRELSEEDPLHRPDISPSEIAYAIQHLPRGKALGWDGLPCELLVAFNEDFFAGALARVFAASRLGGALPPSTRRSSIRLVPKAHDDGGRGLEGYRPVALPSADYRVPVLEHRNGDGRRRGGHRPVDLESAFDSLDRGFLESQLTSLRLPPAFIAWINILYATIRAGGFYTTTFPLLNGLRQGCAVSAVLFSIATGPLLRRLELTLGVGNVIAYADDIVLLFNRDGDFERVATVLEDYRQASGIGVNLRNSAGLWCGAWRNRGDSPLGASWSTTSIRVLGLDIAPRSTVAHREQHLLALLDTACRRWTPFTRGLSLVERSRAANSLVGSTIQHHLHGYLPSPRPSPSCRPDWRALARLPQGAAGRAPRGQKWFRLARQQQRRRGALDPPSTEKRKENRTISRRLVANGLHSCRPLRRLPLTPPNRRQRLEWCRARSTWMTEWHRVVFSDESRFCLSSDNRRVRVWRRRGERSNPAAIVERPTVRQRGIMVWGAIAYDFRSPLLRIQGTMTAQRYVDYVLRPVTLPYLQGVPNALYQQDNARPHTARISQQALQDVQMLPWPPYSPDLSPIEHVWEIIGRRLHALPQPRSEDELWQMVEREWRAIPEDVIRSLIDSLPRHVAACIAVRGGPTCY